MTDDIVARLRLWSDWLDDRGGLIALAVLLIAIAAYSYIPSSVSRATVITQNQTFENCHVRLFFRSGQGGISLETEDGRRVFVQGQAIIIWNAKEQTP